MSVVPVIVGDVAPDDDMSPEAVTAVLGATREALVNAAKHAQVDNVDLFAEVEPDQISVFVRDRGVGFDPDAVPGDRQGLARSIRTRIERRGGRTVGDQVFRSALEKFQISQYTAISQTSTAYQQIVTFIE